MDENECEICDHIVKVCDRLGNKELCEDTIQDFKENKIPIEQVFETINKNFNEKDFFDTWDMLASEENNHGSENKK